MSDLIIIAHRGASGHWPENSLLAFRQALEAGANWLELDIHRSADGELVVIHDPSLQRTTSGHGLVATQTLTELRQLDIGQGEKIPLLTEVLDLAAGRATVNVELKGMGVALPLAKLLQERLRADRQPADDILASSLYEGELILFAGQMPQVRVAPVADRPNRQTWLLAAKLNAWSVHVAKAAVNQHLITTARQQQRKLLVYTVNALDELEQLKQQGVDGVFSDYPEQLIDELAKPFHGR